MTTHVITCDWQGKDLSFVAKDAAGHSLIMDSSKESGGEDAGFRPMQMLLVGLSGCMGMDILLVLQKKRYDIKAYNVRLEGEVDTEAKPKVYKRIVFTASIKAEGLTEEEVHKAIKFSEENYCAVNAMLSKVCDIVYKVELL